MGCGGVAQRTRHVSFARAPKVPAMPRRGSGGFPWRVATGTEFGPNLERNRGVGDRPEIAGDRMRSNEIDRDRPTFADLRSTSPASGPFDPIWSILKPPNYIALHH